MKTRHQLLVVILCFPVVLPDVAVSEDNIVRFPAISECRAMTSGPKEHLFASYYGINSWDATQRYATYTGSRQVYSFRLTFPK